MLARKPEKVPGDLHPEPAPCTCALTPLGRPWTVTYSELVVAPPTMQLVGVGGWQLLLLYGLQ